MIFCCWIFFAFRVLDHIPKFRFIDIYTVIIISISTNNSMLPVNKHQKNVSASCFGERKTCCGCKVDFFEASVVHSFSGKDGRIGLVFLQSCVGSRVQGGTLLPDMIRSEWTRKCPMSRKYQAHTIHGNGIFTYMSLNFLW